jgi:hypothetical protein
VGYGIGIVIDRVTRKVGKENVALDVPSRAQICAAVGLPSANIVLPWRPPARKTNIAVPVIQIGTVPGVEEHKAPVRIKVQDGHKAFFLPVYALHRRAREVPTHTTGAAEAEAQLKAARAAKSFYTTIIERKTTTLAPHPPHVPGPHDDQAPTNGRVDVVVADRDLVAVATLCDGPDADTNSLHRIAGKEFEVAMHFSKGTVSNVQVRPGLVEGDVWEAGHSSWALRL